jgi:hypothetical protein
MPPKKENQILKIKLTIPREIKLRDHLNKIFEGLLLPKESFSNYMLVIIYNILSTSQAIDTMVLKPPIGATKIRQTKTHIMFNTHIEEIAKIKIKSDLFEKFKLLSIWENNHLTIELPLGFNELIRIFHIFNNKNTYASESEFMDVYNKEREIIYRIIQNNPVVDIVKPICKIKYNRHNSSSRKLKF